MADIKEYLKSITALKSQMIPFTVKRLQEYASASKIRADLMSNNINNNFNLNSLNIYGNIPSRINANRSPYKRLFNLFYS